MVALAKTKKEFVKQITAKILDFQCSNLQQSSWTQKQKNYSSAKKN